MTVTSLDDHEFLTGAAALSIGALVRQIADAELDLLPVDPRHVAIVKPRAGEVSAQDLGTEFLLTRDVLYGGVTHVQTLFIPKAGQFASYRSDGLGQDLLLDFMKQAAREVMDSTLAIQFGPRAIH